MSILRACLIPFLVLLMTLTGLGAAAARGQMAADRVVCGNGTPTIVVVEDGLPLFDANGDPVVIRDTPCLDCTLAALALAPVAPGAEPHAARARALAAMPHHLSAHPIWRMGGKGRSPPDAA